MDKRETENIIAKIAKWGLLCLVCLIFMFLSWNSLRYISYVEADYANKIIVVQDSILRNLLAFGMVFVFLIVLRLWINRILTEKVLQYLAFAAGAIAVGISLWWAFASQTKPDGDQLIVSMAAVRAKDNFFEMLTTGGYLHYYPQQLGLVLFLEQIFRWFGAFEVRPVYIIFSVLNGVTVLFGYDFLKEADFSRAARLGYLIFMSSCLPYFFYTPYVYGDIPSVCLAVILFRCMIKWEKTEKYRYLLVGCIVTAGAVLVRKNSLIVVCGVLIGLLLMAINRRKVKHLVAVLAVVLAVGISLEGVEKVFELRSGMEVQNGIPAELFMAMGMQNSEAGPGRYNDYTKQVFRETGFDVEESKRIAKEEMRARWAEMYHTPGELSYFYHEKLLTQWTDPFFACFVSNHNFKCEPGEFVRDIYAGPWNWRLKLFCDRYQFLIYTGCLLSVFFLWRKREVAWSIPLITIVGGFLFSIIWEAQGRYTLPYYIFSIPYAAYGLTESANYMAERIRRLISRDKNA